MTCQGTAPYASCMKIIARIKAAIGEVVFVALILAFFLGLARYQMGLSWPGAILTVLLLGIIGAGVIITASR